MPPRPPSRHDNPFATCWTRPGALPFVDDRGLSIERLAAAWSAAGRRGQVVGPHGVGKSTLLLAAGDRLAERGETIQHVVFRADEPARLPPLPRTEKRETAEARRTLLIDGLEQLGWRGRRLLRRCDRAGFGVLAATHTPAGGLPVLAELAPSPRVVLRLHRLLTSEHPSPVTSGMALAEFAAVGGDLRELWFRLYDLHEALARPPHADQDERALQVSCAVTRPRGGSPTGGEQQPITEHKPAVGPRHRAWLV